MPAARAIAIDQAVALIPYEASLMIGRFMASQLRAGILAT
jgi:hypothetical protein